MSKNKKRLPWGYDMKKCFIAISALAFCISFGILFISHGEFWNRLFFNSSLDTGMDFFHSIEYVKGGMPYEKFNTLYPPLANFLFYILLGFIPYWQQEGWAPDFVESINMRGTYNDLRVWQPSAMVYILFILISAALLVFLVRLVLKRAEIWEQNGVALFVVLSYGVLYNFDRGNIMILAMICCLFYVLYYDSDNRILSELSLILLAFSAGLKLFPAFFGMLLIYDKAYKKAIRCIIYGLVLFALPSLAFREGFKSISMFVKVLLTHMDSSSTVISGFSFSDILNAIVALLHQEAILNTNTLSAVGKLGGILLALLCIASGFVMKKKWQKALCCCVAMLIFSSQATYAITFFIIPFLFMLQEEEQLNTDNIVPFFGFILTIVLLPIFDNPASKISFNAIKLQIGMLIFIGWILKRLYFQIIGWHFGLIEKDEPEAKKPSLLYDRSPKIRTLRLSHILFYIGYCLFLAALSIGAFHSTLIGAELISNIYLFLALLSIMCGNIISFKEPCNKHHWSLCAFFGVCFLFWGLSLAHCRVMLNEWQRVNAFTGVLSFGVSFLICIFRAVRYPVNRNSQQKWYNIEKRLPLLGICFVFVCLFSMNFRVWNRIDSYTYYSGIVDHAGTWKFDFIDMEPLTMGGHLSYAYSAWLTIGELLFPQYGYGQRIAICVLSLIAIVCFYRIIEKVWNKDKWFPLILTFIYTFAPPLFGTSYLINIDYALLCFLTILFYAHFYNNRFLKCLLVLSITFTKETGALILFGLFMGEAILKFFARNESMRKRVLSVFTFKRVLTYIPVFCFFIIIILDDAGWAVRFRELSDSAPSETMIEYAKDSYDPWRYPVYKLFELFLMNFNWMIWAVAAITFVLLKTAAKIRGTSACRLMIERLMPFIHYYVPILTTYAMFCVVSIAYFTYIHYRYVIPGHLFFVLCLGMLLQLMPLMRDCWKRLFLVPFSVLMAIESFVCIDPVTFAFFNKFDAGNGELISTRKYCHLMSNDGQWYWWEADYDTMKSHFLADGMEYSREVIGLQNVMEEFFIQINYSPDKLVVLDMFTDSKGYMLGQLFGRMKTDGWYWDNNRQTVVEYPTDAPISIATDEEFLSEMRENPQALDSYSEIYYLAFPLNGTRTNDVLNINTPIDTFDIGYQKWKIRIYRLV